MLTTTGQRVFKREPKAKLVCVVCAMPYIMAGKADPGLSAELRAELSTGVIEPNTWKERN